MKHLALIFIVACHVDAPDATRYLAFQKLTFSPSLDGTVDLVDTDKTVLAGWLGSVVQEVGSTGDANAKLAFAVGPLAFDMSDADTRTTIDNAFAVAREQNVAVVIHIDDQMFWRTSLSVEWSDWSGTMTTGRYVNWGMAAKLPPSLCLNSPDVEQLVADRAQLIGAAIAANVDALADKSLFAGVIVGWESQIGHDYDTRKPLGFCALANRGFSATQLPADLDLERQHVVTAYIARWADALVAAGVARDKVFGHFAFVAMAGYAALAPGAPYPEGPGASYSEYLGFTPPAAAFDAAFSPGFSTYDQGDAFFQQIYDELDRQGARPWASSEGVPSANAEAYLARMYNHGATLVNLFAHGQGAGTDTAAAIAAYRKFLAGDALVE